VTSKLIKAYGLLRMLDDGFRYELVKGELRRTAPAGHEHGIVTMRLSWRLARHVETNKLGAVYAAETGFLISTNPNTVRTPDVAFVNQKHLEEIGDVKEYWHGPPDLAIEVISPADTFAEVEEKTLHWMEAGARIVLILNPRTRTVTVYRSLSDITILTEEAVLDIADVVPGFQISLKNVFE
jgi:Uma2 family endonuclease